MYRMGDWWLRSKSDPRWDCDGRDFCGGYVMPGECKRTIEEKAKTLGDPPKDLTWEYMKD